VDIRGVHENDIKFFLQTNLFLKQKGFFNDTRIYCFDSASDMINIWRMRLIGNLGTVKRQT
jgi:hypothetical protein